MKKSLLVVAHGSRRQASNDEVRALTERVRAESNERFAAIECAFLELAEPSIPDGLERLIADGAAHITVLPYFLAAGRHVIEELKHASVKMTTPILPAANSASPLAGKTIVITGMLEGFDRKALTEELQSFGAKVTSSVSKNTDLLIAGESPGSKLDKARELGVEVWDETKLAEAIRDE